MSFADRMKAGAPHSPGLCRFGAIAARLPKAEREALLAMAADPAWPITGPDSIQEALEQEGHPVLNDKTIRKHRKGGCPCEPR